MRLLIDSHVLVWWGDADGRLSKRAASALSDPGAEIFISVVSAWELVLKESVGKLRLSMPVEQFVVEQVGVNEIQTLAVELEHAFQIARLQWHHRDPFDRMLVAQAQVEKLAIVTGDPLIGMYDVKTIW